MPPGGYRERPDASDASDLPTSIQVGQSHGWLSLHNNELSAVEACLETWFSSLAQDVALVEIVDLHRSDCYQSKRFFDLLFQKEKKCFFTNNEVASSRILAS